LPLPSGRPMWKSSSAQRFAADLTTVVGAATAAAEFAAGVAATERALPEAVRAAATLSGTRCGAVCVRVAVVVPVVVVVAAAVVVVVVSVSLASTACRSGAGGLASGHRLAVRSSAGVVRQLKRQRFTLGTLSVAATRGLFSWLLGARSSAPRRSSSVCDAMMVGACRSFCQLTDKRLSTR